MSIFGIAKKFTDAFFDGLKTNTVNSALKQGKEIEKLPPNILKRMREIKELETQLEEDEKNYY